MTKVKDVKSLKYIPLFNNRRIGLYVAWLSYQYIYMNNFNKNRLKNSWTMTIPVKFNKNMF